MKRLLAGLAILAMLPTLDAFAAANYISVKGGAYIPLSSDLDAFDAGPGFELGLGRFLHPDVGLELSVGRFTTDGTVNDGRTTARVDITVVPIAIAAKRFFRFGDFAPFAGIGLAVYRVTSDPALLASGIGSGRDTTTTFGYFPAAGFDYEVGGGIFLGLEARYLLVARSVAQALINDIDGLTVTGSFGVRF